MDSQINGFTGFGHHNPGFVSAKDAIRKAEIAAQAAKNNPVQQARQTLAQAQAFSSGLGSSAGEDREQAARGGAHRSPALKFAAPVSSKDTGLAFDPDKLARIPEQDRRWSWVEVDLSAIRHNTQAVRSRLAHGVRLMAVVKADAYGHGAVPVAKMALNSGADYLGVATVDEAIQLREALIGAPILVLSQPPAEAIPLLLGYKVMPAIYTADFAIAYAEAADAFGISAPFHLAVNTGMNRIGVRWDQVTEFMRQIDFHRALELVGTFTHFATADCTQTLDFQIQTKRFLEALSALRMAGVDPGIVHAANSAAAIRFPDVHFDMVRLGISLYGFYPCNETLTMINLKPAMAVYARISDVRTVPLSDGVSYGLHYRSRGPQTKICTIPIGYADGLRRSLSSRVRFLYNGALMNQVGNICMDQCMFEVDPYAHGLRDRHEPAIGDLVTIIGGDGDNVCTVEGMCELLNTIPHEVCIDFGTSRMPRLYRQ